MLRSKVRPFRLIVADIRRQNGGVDDPMELLEQVRHVGGITAFGQLLVDRLDVVVALGIGIDGGFGDQRLEADEHLSGQYLEPAFRLIAAVDGLTASAMPLMRTKPFAPISMAESNPRLRTCASVASMASSNACTRSSIGATISSSARAIVAQRILRQRGPEAGQHAAVIDDQAAILAGIDAVGPRDGLHQGVRFDRLVDV